MEKSPAGVINCVVCLWLRLVQECPSGQMIAGGCFLTCTFCAAGAGVWGSAERSVSGALNRKLAGSAGGSCRELLGPPLRHDAARRHSSRLFMIRRFSTSLCPEAQTFSLTSVTVSLKRARPPQTCKSARQQGDSGRVLFTESQPQHRNEGCPLPPVNAFCLTHSAPFSLIKTLQRYRRSRAVTP